MIIAFHGEHGLKAAVMDRLREHRRLDQIAQRFYYDEQSNRGCHLGCLTHHASNAHEAAERLFGIEKGIGYWLEAVFEGLPSDECAKWVIESTEAIPVGADMSKCHHHLGIWLPRESGLLTITDVNRVAIDGVANLHAAVIRGEDVTDAQWFAARSAAWSAARSAAEFAARSAAWSAAESAAWSAARSAAWSATRSAAESAARSAAESAAWRKIAAKSIEIFAAAPVVAGHIDPAIEAELCCRNLWCRDGKAVVV